MAISLRIIDERPYDEKVDHFEAGYKAKAQQQSQNATKCSWKMQKNAQKINIFFFLFFPYE